ncbi:MAG: heme lyase CcmF/NrfE family subunit [Nitrospinaceae bacterium]|nr:heme lyase CcmF/NrfE family subunit [Nitrospinaceae bacterium]NIR56877.1 heme lyase CcmF/NrfE family subunit [Nitrospinaceae bacterium]NIS84580.1 heme lyase CcmF/NrfE family subunit [Nitrospinaceae bacterium]NIT81372.1 heme lyase CcmF/NrfE family subunit [Nitrospinaceae bacterium]NIU43659.1 heme lyase CcmF/NrfE family subunit [Nitrospinaceae bacterium]
MNDIGEFALRLALATSIYGVVSYIMAFRSNRVDLYLSADKTPIIVWGCVLVSSIALWRAFMVNDFSLEYVAAYSNIELDFFYKFSSFWGGQKGSLLFWALILTTYMMVVHIQNRKQNVRLVPIALAVMMVLTVFFLGLLNFSTNPFERIPLPPEDGRGLNPLLQNYWMVIHPPTLYLGYVGFTVPFAFATAALLTKNLDDGWIRMTRKWTLVSWFFLCMGNLFGAQWAYIELGWGGYWAWDPVENAAFMPLIIATAYLHSVMIQEKKDMMKVWNMSLILLTYVMTIFGTFITRSGLIQSVHTFDEATLGYYFLAFLGCIILFSVTMILKRLPLLKSKNELDSFLSRESSFLLNNLVLLGIAFATFWGTIFPIVSEAFRGVKITVGPPFYNQVNVPIGMVLLALIGIGPVIAWRKASWSNLKKNFTKPVLAAAIGGAALFPFVPLTDKSEIFTYLTFILCIFVMTSMVLEFLKGTGARMQAHEESPVGALSNLVWKNKSRYGGYIVHLGVVLLFAGIAGSQSYSTDAEKHLKAGERLEIRGYDLIFEKLHWIKATDKKERVIAQLGIERNGRRVYVGYPEKEFYTGQNQPVSEVDLWSTLKEDVYMILADFKGEQLVMSGPKAGYFKDGSATIKVYVKPMVSWMWLGGWVMAFGTMICVWPDRLEARRRVERMKKQEALFMPAQE